MTNVELTRQILYKNHALARLLYTLESERDAGRAREIIKKALKLADANAAKIVQLHDWILDDEHKAQRAAAAARN